MAHRFRIIRPRRADGITTHVVDTAPLRDSEGVLRSCQHAFSFTLPVGTTYSDTKLHDRLVDHILASLNVDANKRKRPSWMPEKGTR